MKTSSLIALLGTACLLTANADPALAQATRTWVSGVGDDVNPCSRTAPCKTFAGAISKTAANGEINCMDPGGFGVVTITKSITIDCRATFGSILAAGLNGINVDGANVVVTIRNLSINGAGVGLVGINFISGLSLEIDNVNIFAFNAGSATGIRFAPNSANSTLLINNSTISSNGIAPSTGGGIVVQTSGVNAAVVMIERTTISKNLGIGVLSIGAGSLVRINNSVITGNAIGVASTSAGVLRSYKNNAINGNGSDGTPITPENLN